MVSFFRAAAVDSGFFPSTGAGVAEIRTLTQTMRLPYFLSRMATRVNVVLGKRSYVIHIGRGLWKTLGALVRPVVKGGGGLLVSDETVAGLYGAQCAASLREAGLAVEPATVPAGETSKSGEWLFHLYDTAASLGLDRRSFVVALGGGVVGDLAGFMAATYLRGIQYVQVPTTLLAMVDSAVGGKTGINLPQGKNLVGAFHQPALVVADLDTLQSLPERERRAGLAEVVKYGVIKEPDIFRVAEEQAEKLIAGNPDVLEPVVARCCEIKAEVVEADEQEAGLRAILNFGHTVGHAVEAAAGYGALLHGEAVAVGMAFAARLSVRRTELPKEDCQRLEQVLRRVGLPTAQPTLRWRQIRDAMGMDKKGVAGSPRLVLAERLGRVVTGCEVDEETLRRTWEGLGEPVNVVS